jgi:hypothetical protein
VRAKVHDDGARERSAPVFLSAMAQRTGDLTSTLSLARKGADVHEVALVCESDGCSVVQY